MRRIRAVLYYAIFAALGMSVVVGVYRLAVSKYGTDELVIGLVFQYLGWVFALGLAAFHLYKAREQDQLGRKEQLRMELDVEAFRTINAATYSLSAVVGGLATDLLLLPSWPPHLTRDEVLKRVMTTAVTEGGEASVATWKALSEWTMAIESYQVAVLRFESYRICLFREVELALQEVRGFQYSVAGLTLDSLFSDEGIAAFRAKCEELSTRLHAIVAHLADYRVELVNALLGGVFDARVPHREPIDSKNYPLLSETATDAAAARIQQEDRQRATSSFAGQHGQ